MENKYGQITRYLEELENGECELVWDELEEIIEDYAYDGKLTQEQYENAMRRLMEIDE